MRRTVLLLFVAALALAAADVSEDLLAAARKGDLATVKVLIEKGAALETKTAYGQTPLYLAAMNGHEEVVRFLLEKGAVADVQDTFYKAPMLAFVLARKHYGVARMLAPKLPQAALDKFYESALAGKQNEVAELLKKAGAREPAPAVAVDAKVLESYAGTYKAEGVPLDIKVFVKEGKLYMQGTGQPEFAMKAASPTQFVFAPAGVEIEFDSIASFTLKQGGKTIRFKKVVTQ